MNKQTLALALGETAEGDEELDAETAPVEGEPGAEGEDPLTNDLELAFDPASDPTTRAEAFRRAVKAAMR